jgi:hypothetical protein
MSNNPAPTLVTALESLYTYDSTFASQLMFQILINLGLISANRHRRLNTDHMKAHYSSQSSVNYIHLSSSRSISIETT